MRPRYVAELWNEYMHRLITNLPAPADTNAVEACAAAADRCLGEYRRRFPVMIRALGEAKDYLGELHPPPESPVPADAGYPRELLMAAAVCWALAGMGAEKPHIDRTPGRARLGEWTVYPGDAYYLPTMLHVYRHGILYRTARIDYISKDFPEVADTYQEALAALVGAAEGTP